MKVIVSIFGIIVVTLLALTVTWILYRFYYPYKKCSMRFTDMRKDKFLADFKENKPSRIYHSLFHQRVPLIEVVKQEPLTIKHAGETQPRETTLDGLYNELSAFKLRGMATI